MFTTATFIKNFNLEYISICEAGLTLIGKTQEELDSYDRFTVHDFIPDKSVALEILSQDRELLRTREDSYGRTIYKANGQWVLVHSHHYVEGDTLVVKTSNQPFSRLFYGWESKLNHEERFLQVKHGKLYEDDLYVLHKVLHGTPRKVIANALEVSVKAVEKRLAKINGILRKSCGTCGCLTLHACIYQANLTTFLMCVPNWFEIQEEHTYKCG